MDVGKNGQKEALMRYRQSTLNSGLNFKDILKEKADLGEDDEDSNLLILSYPQYCRYRSMLKRIQDKPSSILTDQFVLALGGIAVTSKNPQIFYCRDTFDHPTLIENESICDEFGKSLHSYFLFT
ncbi:AT-rich interactive domain-containing protein 5B-like [Meleagris gallopavo]|uniref:AT-rich interactive domain-containing protein 5B-like n=1 Tax=Meleagris gallopavo TaxID=9103 RepID=UPI00054994A0|nr:AT-rich interactive domain-containing protein 5B-like [Meleagris gallopavo]